MAWIAMPNENGTKSLVHADNEGAYLANHGVKGQRWGVRRFQNPDVSLTEKGKRRMKTLQDKSDKLDAKKVKLNSPKNKDSYALTNHGSNVATKKDDKAHTKYAQEAKIDRKKIKVESKLNPLKEIDAEYARSLAEKVDKRKGKK